MSKPVFTDEVCPCCDGCMVEHPDYDKPYCGSWEYMEGGCPPPPQAKKGVTDLPMFSTPMEELGDD